MSFGIWFPRLAMSRTSAQRGRQVRIFSALATNQIKPQIVQFDVREPKPARAEAHMKRGGGVSRGKAVDDWVQFQVNQYGASKAKHARRKVSEGMSVADQVKLQVVQPGARENFEKELTRAAECVAQGGGRIVPPCQSPFASYKECQLGDWDSVCGGIAEELGLTAKEQADLARAPYEQNGIQVAIFQDTRQDQALSTRLATYCVACDASTGALHCAYAWFDAQLDLEVPDGMEPPREHQLECNGRTFAVLPSKAPGDSKMGEEMVDQDDVWIDIPAGWRPVDSGASDFQTKVLPNVIARNWWATDWLLARSDHDEQRWSAWNTRMCGKRRGKRAASNVDWFEVRSSERRCVFRAQISDKDCFEEDPFVRYTWPARLLIERIPGPSEDLLQDWRAYVQMRASTEWTKQLLL